MAHRQPALVAIACVAILVAGCADDNPQTEQFPETQSEAAVAGLVVDDGIRPLPGAGVQLLSGGAVAGNATTDGQGTFRIDGLAAGAYVLSIRKFGYLDGLVTVTATNDADAPLVQIVLQPDPRAQRPYSQSLVYEGFMDCAMTFASPCQALNSTTGLTTDSSFFAFTLDPQPAFVQIDFVWDSTSPAGEGLEFYLEVGVAEPGCTSDLGLGVMGPSPLQMRIPGLDIGPDRGGAACDFQFYTYAGDSVGQGCIPVCMGATVSQAFRVHLTAFYGYEPPPDWRFIDGNGIPPPAAAT